MRRVELIQPLRLPTVAVDINDYEGKLPGVMSDDLGAGRLAAEHLLRLGFDRFAFCGFEAMRWSQGRCQAFCETIEQAGFTVDVYRPQYRRTVSWSKEEPLISDWLKQLPKPIGLFCANDDRSAGILESCRVLGYGVPEDIAVVGADDDPMICELANPPLSSVTMASECAGYQLAGLLHSMIRGETKMTGQRIQAAAVGVAARQSTDILMVRDADVRAALQFIRQNVSRPIQVARCRAGDESFAPHLERPVLPRVRLVNPETTNELTHRPHLPPVARDGHEDCRNLATGRL